jgi:predicted nucleic acid-binding protein
MILADTSVWIEHFRGTQTEFRELLAEGLVLVHPFVIGELACGNLKQRKHILKNLQALPLAVSATDEEVLRLIEDSRLWGRGIGWVDGHLLASALLSNCPLWTLDRRLNDAGKAARVPLHRRS